MMFGSVIESRTIQSESASLTYTLKTNITLAEPAQVIQSHRPVYPLRLRWRQQAKQLIVASYIGVNEGPA
jgi:hypothetical protein